MNVKSTVLNYRWWIALPVILSLLPVAVLGAIADITSIFCDWLGRFLCLSDLIRWVKKGRK